MSTLGSRICEIRIKKVQDNKHMLILSLLGLGNAMLQEQAYQLAIHHTEQALSTYEKMNEHNPELYCKILLQLAKIHEAIGHANIALRYYQEAIELHEQNI